MRNRNNLLEKCAYKQSFIKKGIKVHEIKKAKISLAINDIKKILVENPNEKKILISNLFFLNVIFLIFFKNIKNLKIIVSERTAFKELYIYFSFFDFIKKFMIKILVYFTYKYADAIVTNSTRSSNELSKKIGKSYYNFSPSYYFPKIKKVDKGYKKTKVFVTLSRLEKKKY